MKPRTVIVPTAGPAPAKSSAAASAPVVLRDGSAVLIRQVRGTDAPLLADGFARLGAASRQMRFLGVKKELSAAELRYFTDVDHHDHEAIGALDRAAGTAWASPAISAMPATRRQLRSRSPSSMTGKAGDWAPSCWLRCPIVPVRKESAVSPRWPTPVTWAWPRCSATPVPASSVAGGAPSNTRSCWPARRKRAGHAYRGLRGRRRRRLCRRSAHPGRSGCALYRATPPMTGRPSDRLVPAAERKRRWQPIRPDRIIRAGTVVHGRNVRVAAQRAGPAARL